MFTEAVPTTVMHASEAAASTYDPSPWFIALLTIGVAVVVLMYVRRVRCDECGRRHNADYCPSCGQRRTQPVRRNIHVLADRYPPVPPVDDDRDDAGEGR